MIYFFLGIYLKFIPFNNLEKKIPDHFAVSFSLVCGSFSIYTYLSNHHWNWVYIIVYVYYYINIW